MRTAAIAAAFAVGALAVPYEKREEATAYDITYVTDVVTVTAGHSAPTAYSSHHSSSSAAAKKENHSASIKYSTHSSHHSSSKATPTSTWVAPTTEAVVAVPTSVEAAPVKVQAAPSAASAAVAPSGTDYASLVVYHHNLHRANHSSPDITWNQGLADVAQQIGQTCDYSHNVDIGSDQFGTYGQNIAAGIAPDQIGRVITDMFYNGEYDAYAAAGGFGGNPDMSNFDAWGHLTQVVWKDSTQVGCATVDCSATGLANAAGMEAYFTVCNYLNAGNYDGEYAGNVLQSEGLVTALWNAGMQIASDVAQGAQDAWNDFSNSS